MELKGSTFIVTGGASGSALADFVGTNANGVWSLYVFDDVGGDIGNFNGGWTLNGSASLLGTAPGSLLQLTPPEPVLAGSAFWPTPVPSGPRLGVTPGGTPCAALKAWQLENPPPDDPPDTTTGEPGSTGSVGSTGGDPGSTGTPETSGAPGSTSGEPGSTSGTPATTDAGSSGGTPGSDSDPATSAPTEGGAGSTGGGNNTTATATATDGAGADDKGGCACDSPAPGRPGLAALALLGLLGLRRRRRRRA